MRLKLRVIFVLELFLLVALECLEDDDPSCLVPKTQELAGVVEFYYGNYIFLHNLLVGSFVAKKLGELVVAALTALIFVHSLFFYGFNILYELIKNDGLINTRPEQNRQMAKTRWKAERKGGTERERCEIGECVVVKQGRSVG